MNLIWQFLKVSVIVLKITWLRNKNYFQYWLRCKKPIIRLLDYAHRPDVIGTWKHDLIERIIYGKKPV